MLQASVLLYKNAYGGIPKPIWWLALVMFVNRSGTMVVPFLSVYLVQKGYTLTQAGLVMAAFGAGAIIGGFLGGKLTDALGSFYVQVISLLLTGLLFFVLSAMQSLLQIASCILILSIVGEAFRPANAAAIAAYSNASNRTRSYSLNRLAINLGWAIGPAVGGMLASINYNLLFWVDGATCILASLLLFIFLHPTKTKNEDQEPEIKTASTLSAYRDTYFLKGMFFVFLVGLAFFQLFSIVPVYYKQELLFSEFVIGWVLALNGLLIALFEMVLVYKLERQNKSLQYITTGCFLIGISFIVLNIPGALGIVLISMVIVSFGEMFLFPFLNNFWINRSTHSNRGQYAAVYTIAFALAHVMAPTTASIIAMRFGFSTLWLMNFFLCCIASAGFIFLLKQQKIHE